MLMCSFRCCIEQDLKKQAGVSDFLLYWDNNSHKLSIPSPEEKDAVRIMTIHSAKGLEFPIVIFPFAEENYSQYKGDKIWISANEEITGLPKVLVSKNAAVESFGELATEVYQQKQEDLLDNVNVLYVAMTRAKEQLYVISGMQTKGKTTDEYPNNMATFFIKFLEDKGFEDSQLEYEFGSAEKLSETKESKDETQAIPQLSATLNPKHIKIAQKKV